MNKDDILKYFEAEFGIEAGEVDENTGLFSEGLLDSFSIGNLVLFLEDNAGIQVEPTDIVLDNLDSVTKILKFLELKGATGNQETVQV